MGASRPHLGLWRVRWYVAVTLVVAWHVIVVLGAFSVATAVTIAAAYTGVGTFVAQLASEPPFGVAVAWLLPFANPLFFLMVGVVLVVVRVVLGERIRPSDDNQELSDWASGIAGRRIRVVQGGWRRTYSYRTISADVISLGSECCLLSDSALTFVLCHELGHLVSSGSARRFRVNRLVMYFLALREFTLNAALLRPPRIRAPRRSLMREKLIVLFRYGNEVAGTWLCRWLCAWLLAAERLVYAVIADVVYAEEIAADQFAARRCGKRLALQGFQEAKEVYRRLDSMRATCLSAAEGRALEAWTSSGVRGVTGRLALELAMQPADANEESANRWYPSWLTREAAIGAAASEKTGDVPPATMLRASIVLGERTLVSDKAVAVFRPPYVRFGLFVTQMLLLAGIVALLAAGIASNDRAFVGAAFLATAAGIFYLRRYLLRTPVALRDCIGTIQRTVTSDGMSDGLVVAHASVPGPAWIERLAQCEELPRLLTTLSPRDRSGLEHAFRWDGERGILFTRRGAPPQLFHRWKGNSDRAYWRHRAARTGARRELPLGSDLLRSGFHFPRFPPEACHGPVLLGEGNDQLVE